MNLNGYKNYLVDWLRECVKNANAKGLIVGVSGGIDSALVANLIKEAFPSDHLGVIIPIYSSKSDVSDAYAVVNDCEIKHIEINLNSVFDSFKCLYEYKNSASLSNTKARLRMTQLYALASEKNYLVVGTDNMCEWYTGFFTKYGDGGVDIAPLIHLTKSEVYEMAKMYNVPKQIIDKKPCAGLGSNMTDEEEMGVSYSELDKFLTGSEVSENNTKRIVSLHNKTHHKREGIAVPNKYNR